MGNPSIPTDDEHRKWVTRSEETPAERLASAQAASARFLEANRRPPPSPASLAVTGGDDFNDRDRVFLAMTKAARRAGSLHSIVIARDRWPGAEYRAAQWARNCSYRVYRIELFSNAGSDDARFAWIRLVLGLPGLRGIVAFPGADEDLIRRGVEFALKTWRPYG